MLFFFEPWHVYKTVEWELGFRTPPGPEADAQAKLDWQAARDRAEADAPQAVFGSGVWEPGTASHPLDGLPVPVSGDGVLFVVRPIKGEHGTIDQAAIAARVVAAVNYCKGVDLDGLTPLRRLLDERNRYEDREEPPPTGRDDLDRAGRAAINLLFPLPSPPPEVKTDGQTRGAGEDGLLPRPRPRDRANLETPGEAAPVAAQGGPLPDRPVRGRRSSRKPARKAPWE
jgi:hypothetical protein